MTPEFRELVDIRSLIEDFWQMESVVPQKAKKISYFDMTSLSNGVYLTFALSILPYTLCPKGCALRHTNRQCYAAGRKNANCTLTVGATPASFIGAPRRLANFLIYEY